MSLLSSTRTMAVGTVASRATGFLRTAVFAAVLGVQGVSVAFNVANTAPNIVYDLLLGGVLTSIVVPLLVRAAKDDDGGEAYTQRLLSLTLVVLGAASVLLVLLAPQLVNLYASDKVSAADRDLAVVFARFFLPQVLFYGAGAVMGAYLNTRGRYSPPMWAPVLNNVVVIVTGLLFLLVPGPAKLASDTITTTQIFVLGIGVTLGIVAQTVALLPSLHAVGFRFRFRLDLRARLDRGMRLTVSVLVPAAIAYVVLGRAVATVVFAHGETTVAQAQFIGVLLAVFAVGLVPFSAYQLQLRAFYALQDTRTPTLINLSVNVTLIAADVVLYATLPNDLKVVGLAAGQTLSFLVGLAVCSAVLARRVPRDPRARVARTAVRCLVATLPAAAVAAVAATTCDRLLGTGLVGAVATLFVGGGVLGVGYTVTARRLRIPEFDEVAGPVLRRLARSR